MTSIKKDINSTEKLLDVIRGKEDTFSGFRRPEISSMTNQKKKKAWFVLPKSLFPKKKFTVGIEIGQDFIALVKTVKNFDSRYTVADKKIVRFEPELITDTNEFNNLLKSSVADFCGAIADCDIWTKISTSKVNVYFFNIPRVAKKKQEKVVYWTAKKESLIDEEKQIFDFEIQGDIIEQGVNKQAVMFYSADKAEVERITSWAETIGINLAGVTIVPFAMQNVLRSQWMPSTEEIFASLFIGNNYSRIDVYNKENLVMTRGIKTGSGTSMAEAILSRMRGKAGGSQLDRSEAKRILSSISSGTGKLTDVDVINGLKKEEILDMIAPVWERLARQVDLTLKTSSIGNKKVEKIYILSSMNFDQSILDYMSNQLDAKTEFFDPFQYQKSISEKSLNASDRMLLSPALGFALSDNSRTPNINFTYREKNQEKSSKQMNRLVFLSFLGALVICLVTLLYQGSRLNLLKQDKNTLEKELASQGTILSEEILMKTVDKIKMQRSTSRLYAKKYWGLAVIGEISDVTPQNVRLLDVKVRDAQPAVQTTGEKPSTDNTDDVIIEGMILNKKEMLESDLTQYILRLENSPVLQKVSVKTKSFVHFNKTEVMHFLLSAKTG